MDITESQYKFNLALDMIYFLTQIVAYNHPNKIETITEIIDKWDARIHNNLKKIRYNEAQALAEREGIEPDVASIIVSAHQAEVYILKREFSEKIKKLIINQLHQEETKKK